MRAMTVVIHQLNEALKRLQEQTELVKVTPEVAAVEDGVNLVLVPEVPLLEASRDGDLAEDGLEEDEALHDVVHVDEPRSGGQDDAVGLL